MNALEELLSNQEWMIHDLVDGVQIDNDEEARLLDLYEQSKDCLKSNYYTLSGICETMDKILKASRENTSNDRISHQEYLIINTAYGKLLQVLYTESIQK